MLIAWFCERENISYIYMIGRIIIELYGNWYNLFWTLKLKAGKKASINPMPLNSIERNWVQGFFSLALHFLIMTRLEPFTTFGRSIFQWSPWHCSSFQFVSMNCIERSRSRLHQNWSLYHHDTGKKILNFNHFWAKMKDKKLSEFSDVNHVLLCE